MNIITRGARALTVGLRGFARSFFAQDAPAVAFMAGVGRGLSLDVGDGSNSSTVMAPLLWIMRTFPEAPLGVWRRDRENPEIERREHDHPMARIIRRPNPFYMGATLWTATLVDYIINGNGYWLLLRDNGGAVAEVWWAPQSMMRPKGTATEFITHYEYRPNGREPIRFDQADVVHFRFGIDPDDMRLGRSPLASVLREVFTDDEAASFTAAILRNMGVPGLIISPTGDGEIDPVDAEATKKEIKAKLTGNGRGEPIVMTSGTKVEQFGFSPEQLLLRDLRRIPEERVSAVIGVPAVVAGLGAGLDRSTFTNFAEARIAAYEQNIIPTQNQLAEELWGQMLPHFEDASSIWDMRVGFDLARVRVLQPDQTERVKRIDIGVRGGWIKRGEAREALGYTTTPVDDVYLIQSATVERPADGGPAKNFTMKQTENVTPGA